MQPSRPLSVFLCHAHEDKAAVRNLHRRLWADGFEPWLDEEDLIAGQDWEFEIRKAVRGADVVLVCLSERAVDKKGFIQKELRFALDAADEQPEGTIFVIPLKLEECSIPARLGRWHCVNYFEERGHERLLRALRARAAALPPVTPPQITKVRRAAGEEAGRAEPAGGEINEAAAPGRLPASPSRVPSGARPLAPCPTADRNARVNEVIAIACFALSSLLALSLVSYDFNDPAWGRAGSEGMRNLLGTAGAGVARFLFQTLGLAALLLPLLLAGVAWQRFRSRRIHAPLSRLVGLALLVCATAGMLSLAIPEPLWDRSFNAGGFIGAISSELLKSVMGTVGTGLLLCANAAVGLLLATNFSSVAAYERLSALVSDYRKH